MPELAALLAKLVRDVPDFPHPGVLFKDITPLLADHAAFSACIDALAAHWDGQRIDRVLLVDDVLATGGTADATRQLVERCGGVPVALSVLMELSFLHGRDAIGDLRLHPLQTV